MKVKILSQVIFCCLCLSSVAHANDKVNSTYQPALYLKVCKGKTQGDAVSFPYKGIIWNGTCEQTFFPSKTKGITGDEPELVTACAADSSIQSITINGTELKGKCALGFSPPAPKS